MPNVCLAPSLICLQSSERSRFQGIFANSVKSTRLPKLHCLGRNEMVPTRSAGSGRWNVKINDFPFTRACYAGPPLDPGNPGPDGCTRLHTSHTRWNNSSEYGCRPVQRCIPLEPPKHGNTLTDLGVEENKLAE